MMASTRSGLFGSGLSSQEQQNLVRPGSSASRNPSEAGMKWVILAFVTLIAETWLLGVAICVANGKIFNKTEKT